jgi:ankyrin repeat protein
VDAPDRVIRRAGLLPALVGAGALVLAACSTPDTGPQADPASRGGSPTARPTAVPDRDPAGPATPTSGRRTPAPQPDAAEQASLDERLRAAAWADDVAGARRLLRRGADPNAEDATQQSAYLIATSEGHLELLELVLRHGADVRALDSFDGTGLIRAAERGHAPVVGRLLATPIEVDHVNNLGWVALDEAIVLGDGSERYVDTVRALVAGGADLRLPSAHDGVRPLEHAEQRGQATVAATLRRGLEGPERDPGAALLRAATEGDADLAAVALRSGARLEVRDDEGRTPLLLAATHDRVGVARLLVALGADPDALDGRHDTPWLVTGVTGSVAMLEALLPARPDLTIRNRYGGVSVIPASERGHVAYVRRVVRTGIDVDHVNDLGWTALLEAVILGEGTEPWQRIVRILLAAGADPELPDRDGVTALEHAERSGFDEIAATLRAAR